MDIIETMTLALKEQSTEYTLRVTLAWTVAGQWKVGVEST